MLQCHTLQQVDYTMDLLAGYGSGSESEEDQGFVQPKVAVSAAPPPEAFKPVSFNRDEAEPPKPVAEQLKPRLVAPAASLPGADEEDDLVGPARPKLVHHTDDKEIPSISNPEVWSKLPAPKAPTRRVVQLLLPLNKALLAAADDDDEDDQPKKRLKKSNGAKSSLLDLLPAPTQELPSKSRGFSSIIDLTPSSKPSAQAIKAAPSKPQVASNEIYRLQPSRGKKSTADLDSDDDDPMARLGPMPEAGAYASGPIEDADEGPEAAGEAGPSSAAAEHYAYGAEQGGYGYADAGSSGQHDAAAYYVGHQDQAQYGQYAYQQQQEEEDPGQALFAEALKAEQERAARRGERLDMSTIQFKEVNARDLSYMDPAARDAARGVSAALGSEYAAALRAEAKPFEGNKMAKRKHQIGTLFHNARMRELEILEGKTAGMRAKAQTQAKYGW